MAIHLVEAVERGRGELAAMEYLKPGRIKEEIFT
jgi:hypothetical protein